jgi:hypothetical protein
MLTFKIDINKWEKPMLTLVQNKPDISVHILSLRFDGHGHHSRHRSPARIAVDLYKNGELTPGTQILRIGCGQKYQVCSVQE